jgi:hypothetical protein
MFSRFNPSAILLSLFIILLPAIVMGANSPEELNQAQRLIFLGDHLQLIPEGRTVIYDFIRHETGQPDHRDSVQMTVTKVREDQRRDLSFEFLSGADRLPFQPTQGYRGNPVAIQFLERDIRDMSLTTGIPVAFFRHHIRKMFDNPQLEKRQIVSGETASDAVVITITPFKTPTDMTGLEVLKSKQYQFVYADNVPGGLVKVTTKLSGEGGSMLEEELKYREMTIVQ